MSWCWPPYVAAAPAPAALSGSANFWDKPAAPHTYDVEFESAVLPPDFQLFALSSGLATPAAPVSGIDLFTQPAAAPRIEANKSGKPSWILFQPKAEIKKWLYVRKIVLSGTNGWTIKSRLATHFSAITGAVAEGSHLQMCLYKDDGSGTKPAVAAGAPPAPIDGFLHGWESDAGAIHFQTDSYKASAAVFRETGSYVGGFATAIEAVIMLTPGAASATWQLFTRMPALTHLQLTATAQNVKQGDTVWVGWEFLSANATAPSSPILSADYLRFEETAANFLP